LWATITVTLTLTAGDSAGAPVQALLAPATTGFCGAKRCGDFRGRDEVGLTLTREPNSKIVVIASTMPAHITPRKLVLAIHDPAEHAAAAVGTPLG